MNGNKYLKKTVLNLCFTVGALFLGLACFSMPARAQASGEAEVVDRIVAVVNDEIIVLQEVNSLMETVRQNLESSPYSDEEKQRILADMRQTYIDRLVNQKLIVQAAKELEWLTVSEEEIDASVKRVMEQSNLTEEQLREELAKDGLTMEDFRTQLKESSLSSSLENYEVSSKIVITKADVTQYYDQHPEKYQGKTTYHLRNILVKAATSDSTAAKAAVQEKLANIFSELESGQSFQSVARKYSESTNAGEGGELSSDFELEDLLPSFRTAIEPLSPGEYTQALEASNGYQIFYVQEVNKESNKPLDSVYSEIENELYQQQYTEKSEAWIKRLRENAHIKIVE